MSFRTRIFVISVLIVSAVLVAVMSLSWSRIMKVELAYLDARLCLEAKGNLPKKGAIRDASDEVDADLNAFSGRKFTNDLAEKLRVKSSQQLLVLVESQEPLLSFQSNSEVGKMFVDSLAWSEPSTPLPLIPDEGESKNTRRNRQLETCQLASFENEQGSWRASLYTQPGSRNFIAVDLDASSNDLLNAVRTSLIDVIPIAILFSAVAAWIIASITMRPVSRLQDSMTMVTQKALSLRLPEGKEDKEFKVLIDAYNTMLDRLEESFQQTSRFTADAAHELKTPLTILRGRLEQAVNSDDPNQVDLNSILDEVGNLSAITRKLLLLSQADSGSMALHLAPINMSELMNEMIDDLELVLEDKALFSDIKPDLYVNGDITLLRQLFNNLFSNALRYCRAEDGIRVNAHQCNNRFEFTICNHSRPISNEDRQRIFDRFYRGEPAHHQGIAGSGLGLSLAREIARAHCGDLVLDPTAKNIVSLRLNLPL